MNIITGADNIAAIQRVQRVAALCLEINPGMRFGNGQLTQSMRLQCGSTRRRKIEVLEDYLIWMAKEHGHTLSAAGTGKTKTVARVFGAFEKRKYEALQRRISEALQEHGKAKQK